MVRLEVIFWQKRKPGNQLEIMWAVFDFIYKTKNPAPFDIQMQIKSSDRHLVHDAPKANLF
jgi:hypothetical protein